MEGGPQKALGGEKGQPGSSIDTSSRTAKLVTGILALTEHDTQYPVPLWTCVSHASLVRFPRVPLAGRA